MRGWICVLDAPSCLALPHGQRENQFTLQGLGLVRSLNCRTMCTKKSCLNASCHRDAYALSNAIVDVRVCVCVSTCVSRSRGKGHNFTLDLIIGY